MSSSWIDDAISSVSPKKENTINNAGGHSFAITDEKRFLRFLIIGSEKGTYYQSQQNLTLQNCQCIIRLLNEGKGEFVVNTIIDISTNGRASKQGPTLFAFAICARLGDINVRKIVYENLLTELFSL